MSAEKRSRDKSPRSNHVDLNSDEHIARVIKYLNDHPETKILIAEGRINKELLIGRGRAVPNMIRGFMRHSMHKSDRNLVFSFTGELDDNEGIKTHRFHLTMSKTAPSFLPKNVPSVDLVYTGGNLERIDNGASGKAFKVQGFHNVPDRSAKEDGSNPAALKKHKDRESSSESSSSSSEAAASLVDIAEQPVPMQLENEHNGVAVNSIQADARLLARDMFMREDLDVRNDAIAQLVADNTIRSEARQMIFKYLKDEKKLEESLTEAYQIKFEKEREQEQRQHQELMVRLAAQEQQYAEDRRQAIRDAQQRILDLTANEILTNPDKKYKQYRSAAENLAAKRLESDPLIRATATKMAQRAILLEKRDGVSRVDTHRPIQLPPITDDDRAAAAAFVSNN